MASFKCPDCGATLTDDSRFCKYCGAKIDDGVKRVEVKIDKRIEDVADVRRVSYEERESDLRVKQMQQQLKAKKAKRVMMLSVFIVCAVFAAISFGFHMENTLSKSRFGGSFLFIKISGEDVYEYI